MTLHRRNLDRHLRHDFVTAVTRAHVSDRRRTHGVAAARAEMLRYAPAAALAAVVLPDVLATPDGLSFAPSNHEFYATLAGSAGFCGGAACSARLSSACWRSRCYALSVASGQENAALPHAMASACILQIRDIRAGAGQNGMAIG